MSITRINYRRIILAAAGVAVAAFIGGTAYYYLPGDVGDPQTRQVFDPMWQSCNSTDICAPVLAPCGAWEPVNRKFLSEATAYYEHMISVVDESGKFHCAQMPVFGPPPAAICKTGRCAFVK